MRPFSSSRGNSRRARHVALFLCAGLIAFAPIASADYDEPEVPAVDRNYDRAYKLVGKEKYDRALPLLEKVVKRDPANADAWNLLGFSARKTGDLARSEVAYDKALALEPTHLGALEYSGELYLKLDDLATAEERLQRLVSACPAGCDEREKLEQAINEYKAGGGLGS